MKLLCIALVFAGAAGMAQDFTQRGFLDTRAILYPRSAPNDSAHAIGDALLRYEAFWKLSPAWKISAGVDGRVDTHQQVERTLHLDWQDRSLRRPALSLRRLSVSYSRGGLSVEAGKQFVRWGKADILNPTDRFSPKDFLSVVDTELLGIEATRLTYERGSNTVDTVWQPRFTPSRTPLLNQRWTVLPAELSRFTLVDQGARYPGRSGFGARWNHNGGGCEYSFSFYDGFQHLPAFDAVLLRPLMPVKNPGIAFQRFYPALRTYGADAAVPLRWVAVKGEAAWFQSRRNEQDDYVLYVLQLERQIGELSLVGGYAGEAVTARRNPFDFAPERGLARAFLGRAQYTIDPRRTIALDTAVRQNGRGSWVRSTFEQTFGQHWRGVAGFSWIRGEAGDFLGQYRRNSHVILGLRYSF